MCFQVFVNEHFCLDPQILCEVGMKRMCLSQANADLAEAAEKLEAIRKKLAVRLLNIIMAFSSFREQNRPLVIIVFHFPAVLASGIRWQPRTFDNSI